MIKKAFLLGLHLLFLTIFTTLTNAYSYPGDPVSYVSDFADVMTAPTEDMLNSILEELEASTSAQVAIVTIDSLDGDTIENYAVELFEDWGIGQEKEDNGLLLLVAPNDREVRIEVGYGLEPIVTDAQASWIIRDTLIPAFREEQYALGIAQATDELAILIRNEERLDLSKDPILQESNIENWLPYLVFIFFIIQWVFAIMARTKSIWLGGVLGGILGAFLGALGWIIGLAILGVIIDAIVSNGYKKGKARGSVPWYAGGNSGFGGRSSGGFGGFSGGSSGGGGASGRW